MLSMDKQPNFWSRHYWSPKLKELGIRIFKALKNVDTILPKMKFLKSINAIIVCMVITKNEIETWLK